MKKSKLEQLVEARIKFNERIDKLTKKRNLINEKIVKYMDSKKLDLYENDDNKVSLSQNTYTNYNWDYLNKYFNDTLSRSENKKLVTSNIVYSMNENYLYKLIRAKKLTLKKIRKGLSETKSKKFIKLTSKK